MDSCACAPAAAKKDAYGSSKSLSEGGRCAVGVEFDRPSSLFGQLGNPTVTEVAVGLDAKLNALIEKAAKPG